MAFRELLVILVIALLIFGGKKLRSIGSDLGGAVRDFKKAMASGEKEEAAPKPAETAQPPLRQIGAQDADFHGEKPAVKPEQKTNA